MKHYILFFSISLILFSCSSKQENELILFNGLSFSIEKGEKQYPIDDLVKEDYSLLLKGTKVSLPLFKFIKSKNYHMFLALPYNVSLEEIKKINLQERSLLIEEDLQKDYVYRKYRKSDKELSQLIYMKDKMTLILFTITPSKKNIAILSKENLLKRFRYEK